MNIIINQAILIFVNILNAKSDARDIANKKTISHTGNVVSYCLFIFICIVLDRFDYTILNLILFLISSFLNRQLFFDIPLNVYRKLKWDYVSKEPISIVDKIEIRIFGYNGKLPNIIYSFIYLLTTITTIFL